MHNALSLTSMPTSAATVSRAKNPHVCPLQMIQGENPGEPSRAESLKRNSEGPRVRRSEDDPASASPDLPAEGLGLIEKSVH